MGILGGGGGGSNTVFGTGGAANFLVKATRWIAILFAISCLALTYLSTSSNSSVTDDFIPEAAPPAEKATSGDIDGEMMGGADTATDMGAKAGVSRNDDAASQKSGEGKGSAPSEASLGGAAEDPKTPSKKE